MRRMLFNSHTLMLYAPTIYLPVNNNNNNKSIYL